MKRAKRVLSMLVVLAMTLTVCAVALPVSAAFYTPEVTLRDVTDDVPTLRGESKVEVVLNGVDASVYAVQIQLQLESSDMHYKSIEWNSAFDGLTKTPPNALIVSEEGRIQFMVAGVDGNQSVALTDGMVLATLVFEADNGSTGDLTLHLEDMTANNVISGSNSGGLDESQVTQTTEVTASANPDGAEGVTAEVTLVFDQVVGFNYSEDDEQNSNITVSLRNNTTGSEVSSMLDKRALPDGHRDTSQSDATFVFTVENIVAGDYTLTVSGAGYQTVTQEMSLDADASVTIRNDEFKPGRIIQGRDTIGLEEYNTMMSAIKNGTDLANGASALSMDFNRDGNVDGYDVQTFVRALQAEVTE